MQPVDVDEVLQSPAGAATFVMAARSGYGAEALADPALLSVLAAYGQVTPWMADAAERNDAVRLARPLRRLVTEVLRDPRSAWWSAPLDRSAQLLLSDDELSFAEPVGPNSAWEGYAQRPVRGIRTSTGFAGEHIRSGAHAQLACGWGDWSPTFPVRQTRLEVAPTARVYEIVSARDWHELAVRYGEGPSHDESLRRAGIEMGTVPTWSAVARDWDAVHLTFAGLLTARYVPYARGPVTTTLWSWDHECTHWLRPAFAGAHALPDLDDHPRAPPLDGPG